MARIYLAARYSRIEELQEYRRALEAAGHKVVSRWLNGEHQASDAALQGPESILSAIGQQFAIDDWADLMSANWLICFTETPRTGPTRGGRHVEFGVGLAMGYRLVVVGPRENVFYCLARVEQYSDWDTFVAQNLEEVA